MSQRGLRLRASYADMKTQKDDRALRHNAQRMAVDHIAQTLRDAGSGCEVLNPLTLPQACPTHDELSVRSSAMRSRNPG